MSVADYSAETSPITVTLSGATTPNASVLRAGGTDTVSPLATLIGSEHDDMLVVAELTAASAAAIDLVDLGGGVDTVDLSAVALAVTAGLGDAAAQAVTLAGGGVLNLAFVERWILTAGDDVATVGAAGGVAFVDGGAGSDRIDLVAADPVRIVGDAGTISFGFAGRFTFADVETIAAGAGPVLLYHGSGGVRYAGGGGVAYLEGAGAGTVLESGAGGSWIVLRDGATAVSGAGDDLIEAEGAAPVTILFGRGSGHDMLGSHFNGEILYEGGPDWLPWLAQRSESFPERLGDTIVLVGLALSDIELIWDWQEHSVPLWTLGSGDPVTMRIGPAAIRIVDTGETLHLGTLAGAWIGGDFCLVLMGDSEWDLLLDFRDGDGIGYEAFSVDYDLFELGGLRYSLLDLFAPETLVSTPLPAAWSAAAGLLDRLGSEAGAIVGTAYDDYYLTGTAGSDDIFGGAGNDWIEDGDGDDFVRGGYGMDYVVAGAGDDDIDGGPDTDHIDYGAATAPVIVDLAAGTATSAEFGNDRLRSIEGVTGGAGDDVLAGTDGPDYLMGAGGDDLLIGRGGDDSYTYGFSWTANGPDGGNDVIEDSGGYDALYFPWGVGAADVAVSFAPGDSYLLSFPGGSVTLLGGALPAGAIENIFLSDGTWWTPELLAALASPVVETFGTAGADALGGTAGRRNRLVGQGGDDALEGWEAPDTLEGGDGDDLLVGLGGGDLLLGGAGDDVLEGGFGNDTLDGGDGADLIVGGHGTDLMTGGAGADVFRFFLTDSGGMWFADRITDFTPGEDLIDLSGIDADLTTPGHQAFTFIGGGPFSGTPGELRVIERFGDTWVQIDFVGVGFATAEYALTGSVAVTAADFIL
jgi:Ca2+-binding RTX toxin-like protein